MPKYPKNWYSYGDQLPHLREWWYQIYFKRHHKELGFAALEGPFDVGPDFKGIFKGQPVRIEVERNYLSYFDHGHHKHEPLWAEVLVVGNVEPPPLDMRRHLPRIIINIDPHTVATDTEPLRRAYWENKEAEREHLQREQWRWQHEAQVVPPEEYVAAVTAAALTIDDKFRWALAHPGVVIREMRRLGTEVRIFLNVDGDNWEPCPCGRGVLQLENYSPEWGDLTEGQIADQLANEVSGYSLGAPRTFHCQQCGRTEMRE